MDSVSNFGETATDLEERKMLAKEKKLAGHQVYLGSAIVATGISSEACVY